MIPGYTIIETVQKGIRAILYRGIRSSDHLPVIIKTLRSEYLKAGDVERLQHEYDIARKFNSPSVLKAYAIENDTSLILEDFGAHSLDCILQGPMETSRFLKLAIRITAAIAEVHRLHVAHKDIKPQNLLLNNLTGEVKIFDFGIASILPREEHFAEPADTLEATLPYMSPEQTGRTNRAVDYRTDLYSLGITFYEMLTGQLPFQAKDPPEWVHCHVARSPAPPIQIVKSIPLTLSEIVLKLLQKTPEDRYQTALGLKYDLEECAKQWELNGQIERFSLARQDVSDRFLIPQKLYGRGNETAALL